MKYSSIAFALCLALPACATVETGRRFDHAATTTLLEGTTTRQDVENTLGPATTVSTSADGSAFLVYAYAIGKGNGLTGKTQATGYSALFQFNAAGVLIRKTITETTSRAK